MENVLLVIHLLLAIALVFVVLMQRTAQDGGGLTGGGSTMGGLFTARGSANLLTRTTAILATAFIATSLMLAYIASSKHQTAVPVEQTEKLPEDPVTKDTPSSTPQVPVSK